MKTRLIATILCAIMLLPLVVGCGGGNADTTAADTTNTLTPPADGGTGDGAGDGAGDGSVDTESEKEEVALPENMKYDGASFHVLTAGNVAYNDFGYDSDSAGLNAVSEAQYRRIVLMEDQYGVKITSERKQNNNSYGNGPGYQAMAIAVSSEADTYQLGIIGGYDVAALARNDYLYDINSLPWVDTSKSWWDQNANKDLAIGDLLLFTNGSLTAAYSESTFAFYFNKDMAKEYLTEDQNPYQLVRDGKWTVDKLAELSRTVSEEVEVDDIMDYRDRFGIYVWADSMIGMVEAAGSKICTIVKDGSVFLSLDNDRTVNMINAYANIAYDTQYSLEYQSQLKANGLAAETVYTMWGEDKALFWASSTNNLARIRSLEGDFGILPYPKLSEDQTRYYSTIAPYNSQFICVPLYLGDKQEFVGSVIEALAYHGKEIVTPAVYETTLKGAYARDEESYEMLDIIFNSYGYDFGLYYRIGGHTKGGYPDMLLGLIRSKSTAFASGYNSRLTVAEQELAELNANFKELVKYWEEERS